MRAVNSSARGVLHRWRASPLRRQQLGLEFAVFWLPRRTIACERVLQEEGVYSDVAAGELPIDLIPFDADVLSLELDTAFRARSPSCPSCVHCSSFHLHEYLFHACHAIIFFSSPCVLTCFCWSCTLHSGDASLGSWALTA